MGVLCSSLSGSPRVDHRLQEEPAVLAPKYAFGCPLRVGHQAEHVPLAVADTRYPLGGAVRVRGRSTWKPLQIPSTHPPASAYRLSAPMTGEKRAIAPARK